MATRWVGPRRIFSDLRNRRHLDAYVVAAAALVFAVLTVVGEGLPEQLRWAALLAGVGLLVYQVTLPEAPPGGLDDLLHDRAEFEGNRLPERLRTAREVWIFAPSAVNILSAHHCEQLRLGPLGRSGGTLRVVVLDPGDETAMRLATRQLDDSLDYPIQDFRASLQTTLRQLRSMAGWPTGGDLRWRLLDFNPGFSLVAIDPSTRHGFVIVEFHAFHNESTSSRMHLELTRQASEPWYRYWLEQFDRIWQTAREAHHGQTDRPGRESTTQSNDRPAEP